MNRLTRAIAHIGKLLNDQSRPWALAGGLAVSARTTPRFTRDVDIAVAVSSDAEAEQVIRKLRGEGYSVLATVEQEAVERLATVRLAPPGEAEGGTVVDLLFASSGIEPEMIAEAEMVEVITGLSVPLPRIGHLLAVKVLSRNDRTRPQDLADLRALMEEADNAEIQRARQALALIVRRGFHRGRDLTDAFEALMSEASSG